MKCPKCGYYNKADAEICARCHNHRFKDKAPAPAASAPSGVRAAVRASAPAGEKKHLLFRVGTSDPPLELKPGEPFTFGREKTCTLPILSNKVSRLHAEIGWEENRPVIRDKGSSNGTFVGGKRVKEHPLTSGDEIQVGPLACVYRFGDPATTHETDASSGQTIADAGEMLSGQITNTGLVELIQGFEFNTKTGTLNVFARDMDGWLVVNNGVPYAAECGDKVDDEAVIALLMLKAGRFTFGPDMQVKERRMKATLTALLLEWGRRADEAGAPKPE